MGAWHPWWRGCCHSTSASCILSPAPASALIPAVVSGAQVLTCNLQRVCQAHNERGVKRRQRRREREQRQRRQRQQRRQRRRWLRSQRLRQ